ncbi:MAG: DNA-methyltransferase [Candidatus Helarchaeota archaeon]
MLNDKISTKHLIYYKNSSSMQDIHAESVDLVVTSPPYPMIEMWDSLFSKLNPIIEKKLEEKNGKMAYALMNEELNKIWDEVARVLKPGGIACINIGDATRKIGKEFKLFSNHAKIIHHFEKLGFSTLPEILWRKQSNKPNKFMGSGMLPTSAYVTQEHEYILIFRKGAPRSFKLKDNLRYKSAFFWEERNSWFSDIWMDLKGTSQKLNDNNLRKRSAAYPFELAHRLISMYSILGDTVLDPFLGTGTTLFASICCGRNSIGYEVGLEFKDLIEKGVKQIKNFANKYTLRRLKNHIRFIQERESQDKMIKYISKKYGFKVMTKQEIEIFFPKISKINELKNKFGFNVEYSEFTKDEYL